MSFCRRWAQAKFRHSGYTGGASPRSDSMVRWTPRLPRSCRGQGAPHFEYSVSVPQHATPVLHTDSFSAQYHWAVLVLSELNFTLQTDDEDDATVELLVPVVRAQHMTSALAIADLVHLQSVYWGVDHIPISFLEPINAALAVVIGDMEAADRKSSFVKLAVALHGLSRRSVAAESMLRMLRLTLRQRRLMSAKDVDQLFKDARDHWEASVLSPHVGVATASDATQYSEIGTTEETYDMLVEKWNQFNLGALSSSSSSSS